MTRTLNRSSFINCLIAFICVVFLTACGTAKSIEEPTETVKPAVEELYQQAQTTLEAGDYKIAAKEFDDIERLHPASVWAKRAALMSSFAHYKSETYGRAIAGLDRFIKLHPADERIDYAYYLKALSYYDQISDVRRDQEMTERAAEALGTVIRRFPDSNYARDAKLKLDLTNDNLAGREMEVGRYYLKQQIYNAALRRFQNVVNNYQTTSHVAEALYRLTETYMAIGLVNEAKENAALLGHNYPGSDWYEDAYALVTTGETRNSDNFVTRAWRSITD